MKTVELAQRFDHIMDILGSEQCHRGVPVRVLNLVNDLKALSPRTSEWQYAVLEQMVTQLERCMEVLNRRYLEVPIEQAVVGGVFNPEALDKLEFDVEVTPIRPTPMISHRQPLRPQDHHRGHPIYQDIGSGEYRYSDTGLPVAGSDRGCGKCLRPNRADGHDVCIGELPDTMNACCGHGQLDEAYVQFKDGSCIRGGEAVALMGVDKVWEAES